MGREYKTARLRFHRAIAHGERISRLWNEIPNNALLRIKPRIESDGSGTLEATEVGNIPDELSLVLGEHLYQLRSTLDALIYQATIYATGQDPPPKDTALEFPITSNPDEWSKLAKRRLAALPQHLQDGIEHVQPYKAEFLPPEQMVASIARSLGILNDLARKDRHRQLHVIGSWPLEIKPEFDLPPGVSVESFDTLSPAVIKNGTKLAVFRLRGFVMGMRFSFQPNLITNIGCDDPPPPCHPTDTFGNRLAEMINAVGAILEAFESTY